MLDFLNSFFGKKETVDRYDQAKTDATTETQYDCFAQPVTWTKCNGKHVVTQIRKSEMVETDNEEEAKKAFDSFLNDAVF